MQEFLLAKDEELAALREECLRGHAHLDKVATAAQSTEIEKLSVNSQLLQRVYFRVASRRSIVD